MEDDLLEAEKKQYKALMEYSLRALSARSLTVVEITRKLKRRSEYSERPAGLVLERLAELNLLNDDEYVIRAVENRANLRLEGPLKIAMHLRLKGIPMKKTMQAWESLGLNEREICLLALKKKTAMFKRNSKMLERNALSVKKAQYLASRGFSAHVIREVCGY